MENLSAKLPGWKTVRCIGSGSSGKVFEIQKIDKYGGDFSSALKVISVPSTKEEYEKMSSSMSEFALRAKLREQVEAISNEYRLMGVLKGHANIVSVEDQMIVPHDDDAGWDIYIRMELLTSLPDYVSRNGITGGEVIKLGTDICTALEVCRKNGITHRDIKPQNIFVSKYGDFKLGDFGVAKSLGHACADKVGTYSYMAPEVYTGTGYDDSVDIYSLGMVLYWLLNERRGPFMHLPPKTPTTEETADAQLRRYRGEPLPPPKNGNKPLKALVQKACAYNSAERFAAPSEMKYALSLAAKGKTYGAEEEASTVRDTTENVQAKRQTPAAEERQPRPQQRTPNVQVPIKTKTVYVEEEPEEEKGEGKTGVVIAVSLLILAMLAAVFIYFAKDSDLLDGLFTPKSTPAPTETAEVKTEITKIIFNTMSKELVEGDTYKLDTTFVPELKAGETAPSLIWKSTDTSVASVDSEGNITAVKAGQITVLAYLADKTEVYAECAVTVTEPELLGIEILTPPTKLSYAMGEKLDPTGLTVKALYSNNTEKVIDDLDELQITDSFKLPGTKDITVSYKDKTATFQITVTLF